MEYIETQDGQIQADFARRIGHVLLHYEAAMERISPQDSYEATLTICLLQALLTNCVELIKSKNRKDRTGLTAIAGKSIAEAPALFGLNSTCITHQWASDRDLTYREVLQCLRNALSHPLPQQLGAHKTTGYTTWKSVRGEIKGFTFVQSPWVNSTGSDVLPRFRVVEADLPRLVNELKYWSSDHQTSGLAVVPVQGRQHQIYLGTEPFVPVLQIDISTTQLRTLTLMLSEHLSEPLAHLHQEGTLRSVTEY
jgi:hypothetical protein